MGESLFPPGDRELILQTLHAEMGKVHERFDGVDERLEKLEQRQDESEHLALKTSRDSSVADLEQQREIAELWKKMSESAGGAAGAVAGKETADAASKKWTTLSAVISLISLIISTLLARNSEPVTMPERKASAPQTVTTH